jgi:hypothetical protein
MLFHSHLFREGSFESVIPYFRLVLVASKPQRMNQDEWNRENIMSSHSEPQKILSAFCDTNIVIALRGCCRCRDQFSPLPTEAKRKANRGKCNAG